MDELEVGSDFSGVGAFDQALMRLQIKYRTVFACDMDKYARQSYIANYGEPVYYPENVFDRDIPDNPLDIYMTSPPCQTFSFVGDKKGETDEKGVLFYNSHEFIEINKPRAFIFENVKGLLSDDDGQTFKKWIQYLGGKSINGQPVIFPYEKSVPYHIYWRVLNSRDYGVPQNRERVFIVGIRDDQDNKFNWPVEGYLKLTLGDILENDVENKYHLRKKNLASFKSKKGDFGNGFQIKPLNTYGNCVTTKSGCSVITNNYIDCPESETGIRFLTPREYFRLQDFPDDFKFVVSDTQLYKQAGNSITVGVLANIIARLNL